VPCPEAESEAVTKRGTEDTEDRTVPVTSKRGVGFGEKIERLSRERLLSTGQISEGSSCFGENAVNTAVPGNGRFKDCWETVSSSRLLV